MNKSKRSFIIQSWAKVKTRGWGHLSIFHKKGGALQLKGPPFFMLFFRHVRFMYVLLKQKLSIKSFQSCGNDYSNMDCPSL